MEFVIPAGLAERPQDPRRGVPIPAVNEHEVNGVTVIDFTIVNASKGLDLARQRRCSLCANPMGYWVGFLGTPRSAEERIFTDPPAHAECLKAALVLCPHIALRHHRRSMRSSDVTGGLPAGFHGEKPDRWLLGTTRRFEIQVANGVALYLPAPFKNALEYAYSSSGRITAQRS